MSNEEQQNSEFKKNIEDLIEELSVVIRKRGDTMDVVCTSLAWMLSSASLGYVGLTVEQAADGFKRTLESAKKQMDKERRQ
jgi:hypothetical protein